MGKKTGTLCSCRSLSCSSSPANTKRAPLSRPDLLFYPPSLAIKVIQFGHLRLSIRNNRGQSLALVIIGGASLSSFEDVVQNLGEKFELNLNTDHQLRELILIAYPLNGGCGTSHTLTLPNELWDCDDDPNDLHRR